MLNRYRTMLLAGAVLAAVLTHCGRQKKPKYQPRYQTYTVPLDEFKRTAAQIPGFFDMAGYKKALAEAERFKKEKEQEIAALEGEVKQRFRYRQEVLNRTKEVDSFCTVLRQQADSVLAESGEILRKRDFKAVENLIDILGLFSKTTSETLHYVQVEYPPMVESLKTDTDALRKIAQAEKEIETRFNYLKGVEAKRDEISSATQRLLSRLAQVNQAVTVGVRKQDFALLHGVETEAAQWLERFSGSRFDSYAGAMVREFERFSLAVENQMADMPRGEIRKHEKRRAEIQDSYAKETDVNALAMTLSELDFLADMARAYGPLYLEKEYQGNLATLDTLKGDVTKHIEVCQLCNSSRAQVNETFKNGLERKAGRALDRLKQKLKDFTAKAPNEASASLLWKLIADIDNWTQGNTHQTCSEIRQLYMQPVRVEDIQEYGRKIRLGVARLTPLEKFYLEFGKSDDLTSVTQLKTHVQYKIELVDKVKSLNRKLTDYDNSVSYLVRPDRVLTGKDIEKLTRLGNELQALQSEYAPVAADSGLKGIADNAVSRIQGLVRKCKDLVSSQSFSR